MTNLERWNFYCSDISSPQSFIDWSFYYIIAASLQRRVWTGSYRKPLFPNIYCILTAEPGIGKGLITSEVTNILKYYKLKKEDSDTPIINDNKEIPLLIPVGANATSYEALVRNISRSIRSYWYSAEDGKKKPYVHSSICFCLEEISSLFRKHTEDLVRFLLEAYDCHDYRYESISRGIDFIKNCCLNLLGGTQPSFLRRIFGDELLTEGFASRTIFVYEQSNRFQRLRPPVFSTEQVAEYNEILKHIKDLTSLYGEVKFTPEATLFLEKWWQNEAPYRRTNPNLKLTPYYARKNIAAQKLAMILHFSDNTSMEVNREECELALKILDETEKKMHFALCTGDKNPLAIVSDNILKYVKKAVVVSQKELLIEFWNDLPDGQDSLKEILSFLIATNKIKSIEGGKYKCL